MSWPILLKARLTIDHELTIIDFTGSSPASIYGINSPRTYSHAYSVFGLKAIIAPHVPNNAGSLSCFDLVTEPGTCVDPIRPSPVTGRHVIGQMLADAVFGCLAQALPGQVQAESAGSIWILVPRARRMVRFRRRRRPAPGCSRSPISVSAALAAGLARTGSRPPPSPPASAPSRSR